VRLSLGLLLVPALAIAQGRPSLPAGVDERTRSAIEQLVDSMQTEGLPTSPLYAKAAEGRLKHATDAQILMAVRGLASRFREIRASLGSPADAGTMTAAATALSAGVSLSAIRDMRDAASGGKDASADLASALVTVTDLVNQLVPVGPAVTAVQALLVRRAAPEQYTKLRVAVTNDILAGRTPEQAARSSAESIVRLLPNASPVAATSKPPLAR
jgi:hypothetical protein